MSILKAIYFLYVLKLEWYQFSLTAIYFKACKVVIQIEAISGDWQKLLP